MDTGMLAVAPHHTDVAGAIRDWIVAVSAVTAAVGAAWAAIIAARAYRDQGRDRRRAQAASVAAWIQPEGLSSPYTRMLVTNEHVKVRNASKQPVYNVVVLVRDGQTRRGLCTVQFDTLPPEHDETDDVTQRIRTGRRDSKVFLTMSFRDSAGVTWRRDSDTGLLTETATPTLADVEDERAAAEQATDGEAE